jgi:hypothetical protein
MKISEATQSICAGLGAVQLGSQQISSPPRQYSQRVSTFRDAIVSFSLATELTFASACFLLAPTKKNVCCQERCL